MYASYQHELKKKLKNINRNVRYKYINKYKITTTKRNGVTNFKIPPTNIPHPAGIISEVYLIFK